MSKIYVHFGGSWSGPAPREFENFDASPTLRLERLPLIGSKVNKNPNRFADNVRYGDITKGPLVMSSSATGVYCSHVLEHLSFVDCQAALKNTYDMLAHGGIFRFVLPDLKMLAIEYVNGDINGNTFMINSGLGLLRRPKGIKGLVKSFFGNSNHLWLWDEDTMFSELQVAGFKNIRRASYGDSVDPMFNCLEVLNRWEGQLGFECRK